MQNGHFCFLIERHYAILEPCVWRVETGRNGFDIAFKMELFVYSFYEEKHTPLDSQILKVGVCLFTL